ncbi:MAG TPA: DNA-binding transcriptional regulator OxyR [Algoriphagus sp.]|jgi:LysR family hydrogen peroxide-inducible transcriptional activator|uniref:hydrogen peroxide-inducible genes activator n=1 Tax=unclassified Algoriphagus TaxID=2641541 RepID=UPI000C3F72EB|nr:MULTISPECIES: hydrogen peroxide-inducible genes activator [unclassified Algoriphagus]MAL15263.1 DNA-binding transcriptional regulator OxyR [Algoriphagus sp.]MAN87429.1 DNA-binding transcriptional regulator OxyR [Algoriphagus sp.]QYH40691.1 hydrogen peroxide-inducible genes activator [Algoriphagus sp. NBT04N3]HAD52164.1 DNA-binding transcriptional regulator OxyR [Algoriphagus sp.]HAH36780.1 DNA-binding transcriptional regulator OxyR [Algoriphagus sp.]|tara:strand:+ start:126 stop:1058 length:933 start_codon:yes stop_codon:yes gene_type:complete
MTIQQLEYLIAVDKHRHFGQAAESCFVTQPTLSAQLSKLENELGVILFDRSKMPVIPTEIGVQIIAQAKKVVSESRGVLELVAQLKGDISGTIKLGIIPTLAPYLLYRFVRSFLEKYPNVKLDVQEMVTEEVVKRLKNHELDMGIIVTPLGESGIVEKPMFYEKFYAYLSKNHPLLAQKEIKANQIKSEELWIMQQGHCFRDQVINFCDQSTSGHQNFHYESGSLEGLKNMVNRYQGMTLLPELATFELSDEEKSRLRPFEGLPPTREVSIILNRSFLKQKLVELLYNEITEAIPQEMTSKAHGKIVRFK